MKHADSENTGSLENNIENYIIEPKNVTKNKHGSDHSELQVISSKNEISTNNFN